MCMISVTVFNGAALHGTIHGLAHRKGSHTPTMAMQPLMELTSPLSSRFDPENRPPEEKYPSTKCVNFDSNHPPGSCMSSKVVCGYEPTIRN